MLRRRDASTASAARPRRRRAVAHARVGLCSAPGQARWGFGQPVAVPSGAEIRGKRFRSAAACYKRPRMSCYPQIECALRGFIRRGKAGRR
jgi:hypothetical protein